MKNDEEQNAGNASRNSVDSEIRSIALEFFKISISKKDGNFKFSPMKCQVMFAPEQISSTLTEQQANRNYKLKTDAIMAAIYPRIIAAKVRKKRNAYMDSDSRTADEQKEIDNETIEEYNELWSELNSCKDGYIGVDAKPNGAAAYEMTVHTVDEDGVIKDASLVKSHMKDHDSSSEITSENLYRNQNCNARPLFRRALRLSMLCGWIDPDWELEITNSDPKGEDMLRAH